MAHVLSKTYFSKAAVDTFISSLVTNQKLSGDDPCAFWRNVKFLNIQAGGNSQHEMLSMFDTALNNHCGFGIGNCGANPQCFVYLDDAIFSGGHVRADLGAWIRNSAPAVANVHIIVIAIHRYGQYDAKRKIKQIANSVGKMVNLKWWRCMEVEDRKTYVNNSDVLRPVALPLDQATQDYAAGLHYPPVFRTPGSVGGNAFFSSEAGRNLLEQEYLLAGVRIRQKCPNLNEYQRPLGNMVLQTLGFGSMLVTFRNCPNNAPLTLWAGDPWYPLFPRVTNKVTALRNVFAPVVKNLFAPVVKDDLR